MERVDAFSHASQGFGRKARNYIRVTSNISVSIERLSAERAKSCLPVIVPNAELYSKGSSERKRIL